MADLCPDSLGARVVRTWQDDTYVKALLADSDAAHPINVIGQHVLSRGKAEETPPKLHLRTICPVFPGEAPSAKKRGVHYSKVADLSGVLLPRSRTLIVDPFLSHRLFAEPAFIKTLSLKTFDWVIAPFLVRPEPIFALYSEQFSYHEPLHNDHADSWRWTVSPQSATVWIINGREPGPFSLNFVLSSAHPGTFTVDFGNRSLRQETTLGDLAARFQLTCELSTGPNALSINFDGPPFVPPKPMDQRKELYLCFSGLRVEPCGGVPSPAIYSESGVTPLRDRLIRRVLHSQGFFEIQSIATSVPELANLTGLRSCFDYQEGFSFRDYRRFPVLKATSKRRALVDLPVLWYCLRKTPTAGSEWEAASPCSFGIRVVLAEDPAVRASEELQRPTVDLVETRHTLVARTKELEGTRKDLLSRTADLEVASHFLVGCTTEADNARRGLQQGIMELDALTERLLERTSFLNRPRKSVTVETDLRRLQEDLKSIETSLEKWGSGAKSGQH